MAQQKRQLAVVQAHTWAMLDRHEQKTAEAGGRPKGAHHVHDDHDDIAEEEGPPESCS